MATDGEDTAARQGGRRGAMDSTLDPDGSRHEPHWRYDPETDAHYWWDGHRHSMAARWDGRQWMMKPLLSRRQRLARVSLRWAVGGAFLAYFVIPTLVALGYAVAAVRAPLEPDEQDLARAALVFAMLELLLLCPLVWAIALGGGT